MGTFLLSQGVSPLSHICLNCEILGKAEREKISRKYGTKYEEK